MGSTSRGGEWVGCGGGLDLSLSPLGGGRGDGGQIVRWHSSCRWRRALPSNLEEQDGARDRSVQARHPAGHGDPHEKVDPAADRRGEAAPLAPDHEADRPAEVRLAVGLSRLRLSADHANPTQAEAGECLGKVVDAGDEEVLDSSSARLDRRGREGCRSAAGDDDPVDPHRLGAADEASKVLGILDAVEGNKEGVFAACEGSGEQVLGRRLGTTGDDEGDPLVPVESCELADERPFDLDDRDAQRRRVENHLLKRTTALRHDEEANRLSPCGERLLHWASTSDQLLFSSEEPSDLRRDRAS